MALNDIKIHEQIYNSVPTRVWQTEANTTVVKAGELVKVKAAGSKYAIICADGDGVIGTTLGIIGVAATTGTQTASADGTIAVYEALPGIVYEAPAKSAAAANTAAEILALQGKRVPLDVTAGVFSVDTAAADNANNALLIVGGNPDLSTIYFKIRTPVVLNSNLL